MPFEFWRHFFGTQCILYCIVLYHVTLHHSTSVYINSGEVERHLAMSGFPASFPPRRQPRSPAGVCERPASPRTSSPTMTGGTLSTVSSPRLQLSPSGLDGSVSPRGGGRTPRRDKASTTATAAGSRGGAAQRQSTTVRRMMSDTDGGGLPVWRGANMAQSQLMQRRRHQLMKTQQKSRGWQHGLHRTAACVAAR